jgi:hypothetical protein
MWLKLAPVGALRCIAAIIILSEKSIFNLRVDLVKPLFRALGLLPTCFNFGFELRYAVLRSPQLLRKLSRRIDCMSAVFLGDISSFAQKLEDCLTGLIELRVVVSLALSRSCKWNHFGAHCCRLSLPHRSKPPA